MRLLVYLRGRKKEEKKKVSLNFKKQWYRVEDTNYSSHDKDAGFFFICTVISSFSETYTYLYH